MEPGAIPPFVEPAIYCYFVVVAAIGCYLHGRLWIGDRNGDHDDRSESAGVQS